MAFRQDDHVLAAAIPEPPLGDADGPSEDEAGGPDND